MFTIDVLAVATLHQMIDTEDGPVEGFRDIFAVGASTVRGENWLLIGSQTSDEEEAKAFLTGVSSTPATHPDLWEQVDPSYGSDAWGEEDEYNLACFEADCFNEPRPQWF